MNPTTSMPVARGERSTPDAVISALVVDDNPATAVIVGSLITVHAPDAVVQMASDAAEALRMVGGGGLPDLIVVDVHLPGMSGTDLCERIGAMRVFERSVIVCMSAQATTAEVRRLSELPFVHFAAKGEPLIRRLPAYVRAAQERARRQSSIR
jgi:CheY-like chemotaxis protein